MENKKQNEKQKEEVSAQNEKISTQNEELRSINENLEKEVEKRSLDLKERIKELTCIIDAASLANQTKMTAEKLAKELVKMIPGAWHYPEITVCRINLNGTNYKSENFKKTNYLIHAPLHLDKKMIGSIEVCYTEEMPILDEGPFLKEERKLIDALANILENFLEGEKGLVEIKEKNREYQSLAEEYQSQNEELSKANLNLKESESLIRESQKLFKSVFENSSLGKSLTCIDGSLMVNQAFCEMLGYTENEIQNKHWKEFTHEDDIQQSMDVVNSLLAGKKSSCRFEKRFIHKTGKIIYTDVHTTLLKDENNEAKFFITAVSDITKKKELEQKIAKYNLELESEVKKRTKELLVANNELENFAYSVAHDLRAPLRAIIGYSNILQEEYAGKLDEDGHNVINVISRNTSKMSRLIDDILEFSRLGRKEVKKQKIDMNVLFKDVYNDLVLNSNNININFNIGNDLPIIQGDYSMIEILVTNLLTNAIKFSSNTPKPKITIKSEVETEFYLISVADNGVGFDPKYKDKLFDIFQRLHSEKEFPGTGAGLSISQRIVQKHSGKIWGQSQLGKGAIFYFTIAKNL